MKKLFTPVVVYAACALWAVAASTGCSSAPSRESSDTTAQGSTAPQEFAAMQGPAVTFTHAGPATVELNRDFQPMHPAEVTADIKDLTGRVDDVKLQFSGIPLEVPMENVGGTTWRAQLTSRQLEMLSVSGQTIKYKAHVVAHDENGHVGRTSKPVDVAVKTPNVTGAVGADVGAG